MLTTIHTSFTIKQFVQNDNIDDYFERIKIFILTG